MARSLVIVESPAKAKTINRYLGSDYVVKSSVGHVRDLPTRSKPVDPKARAEEAKKTKALDPEKRAAYKAKRSRDQLIRKMGINPDKDWQAYYEILPGKEKVIDELKKFADKADKVYLATDLDREGEAIAWHLKEIIGGDSDKFRRVVFNEITKKAIEDILISASNDGTKIMMSTHDLGQLKRLAKDIIFLHNGIVEAHCSKEEFLTKPPSKAAKQFLAGDIVL